MRTGGHVFHVMNRSARRLALFQFPADYQAFIQVLAEATDRIPLRILSYAVMWNHWHLVVWPDDDRQMSAYMHWVSMTHAERWHRSRGTTGTGAVYQGRYKAVPVQTDEHLLVACRYVERNAVRAGLVAHAEEWPWCSASDQDGGGRRPPLCPWPVSKPSTWLELLNSPEPPDRLEALRTSLTHSSPFGTQLWGQDVARRLGWHGIPRRTGRPYRKAI